MFKALFEKISRIFYKTVVKASYKNGTMTVLWNDGKQIQYDGDCIVWHELPLMTRCDTQTELLLYDLQKYIKKWGGDYPEAHKSK